MNQSAHFNDLLTRSLKLLGKKEWEKAIDTLTTAINFPETGSGDKANLLIYRSAAYLEMGKNNEALQDSNKSIELNPEIPQPYIARAHVYNKIGRNDKALQDCNKAIELDEKYSHAYVVRGKIYIDIGDYDKALEDCDKVLELEPDNKTAINNRAYAKASKDAVEIFKKQVEDTKRELSLEALKSNRQDWFRRIENKYRWTKLGFEIFRMVLFVFLIVEATFLYGGMINLAIGDPLNLMNNIETGKVDITNPFVLFPLILASSLLLSPLVWIIQIINRRIEKLWALEEYAHANFILAQELDLQRGEPELEGDLVRQFFDHHDKRGSAQLIADWKDSDEKGISIVERVKEKLTPPK